MQARPDAKKGVVVLMVITVGAFVALAAGLIVGALG